MTDPAPMCYFTAPPEIFRFAVIMAHDAPLGRRRRGCVLRGTDEASRSLFSQVDLAVRIPVRQPLRKIRQVVNEALARLVAKVEALHTDFGCRSIPPKRLIRASLTPILFSVRSVRQLMEHLQYNLLFRWLVGLGIDDTVSGEGARKSVHSTDFSPEPAKRRAEGRPCSQNTGTVGCPPRCRGRSWPQFWHLARSHGACRTTPSRLTGRG